MVRRDAYAREKGDVRRLEKKNFWLADLFFCEKKIFFFVAVHSPCCGECTATKKTPKKFTKKKICQPKVSTVEFVILLGPPRRATSPQRNVTVLA